MCSLRLPCITLNRTSAMELANQGDMEAIAFLLQRLLNPDLDKRLKTGGIRVILARKADLLHIMCDAPVCPARKKIAAKIINLDRKSVV